MEQKLLQKSQRVQAWQVEEEAVQKLPTLSEN
jgi:hypothetical protein